jgi:hypothetical protein
MLPSNATFLFRVPIFPSATLGEDCLPRVPDFWHSGKCMALGKDCFSRSGCCEAAVLFRLDQARVEEIDVQENDSRSRRVAG